MYCQALAGLATMAKLDRINGQCMAVGSLGTDKSVGKLRDSREVKRMCFREGGRVN